MKSNLNKKDNNFASFDQKQKNTEEIDKFLKKSLILM